MTIILTIIVQYSCPLCTLRDIEVTVPARESEAVDIVQWMNQLIHLLSTDHQQRSPHCQPQTLKDLKIPMTGAAWVGGPTLQ